MTEKKLKKFKADWFEQHSLTPQEVKKLIAEKIERARMYHEADKKRKALIAESR